MSNRSDWMSRFVMDFTNLVREECPTTMLYDDINLDRLIVYAQSIQESKHKRISRNLKGVVQVIKVNLGSKEGSKARIT